MSSGLCNRYTLLQMSVRQLASSGKCCRWTLCRLPASRPQRTVPGFAQRTVVHDRAAQIADAFLAHAGATLQPAEQSTLRTQVSAGLARLHLNVVPTRRVWRAAPRRARGAAACGMPLTLRTSN